MNIEKLKEINKKLLSIGSILMMLSYFPQMITILTSKSSQGISLAFIGMVTLALATFTFNGYVIYKEHGEKKTLYSQLANLIPALITCGLILIYR